METMGLTHVSDYSKAFKTKWIHIVLRKVCGTTIWIDELVKITKNVTHMVTCYPIMEKINTIRSAPVEEI